MSPIRIPIRVAYPSLSSGGGTAAAAEAEAEAEVSFTEYGQGGGGGSGRGVRAAPCLPVVAVVAVIWCARGRGGLGGAPVPGIRIRGPGSYQRRMGVFPSRLSESPIRDTYPGRLY